ncbi:heme-binding protein [Arthrobacter bambusae]|uniref:heme-binding protein n=1 Tax=Arthrobacter bambusae TaxID=1338426 RepID=UPI001F50D8B5|nr:heme-binding protein [Arthrobacter bambusae]MCI0144119.1 heme-binding protein [Arthrobacter bambusae]
MTDQTEVDLRAMLEEIQAEVAERALPHFDHADARRIGSAAAALAERDQLPVVVAVSRGTQRVFHAAFAGTTAEHDDWVRRKINTTMRHEIPSLEFVLRQQLSGHAPEWLDQREFAIAGGAVPIVVDGITVGAIAISGLVGSIREDHDLAMQALRAARTHP